MEAPRIIPIDIEQEMKSSYIDYSMSVIVSRALPDVRDGLKPVQRRVLYGMQDLGLTAGKSYRKSATIVGEVMGKYHPHGDSAIYDTLVRMAQDFAMRTPVVDGQGNFGSIDGDAAAAMRYTEARMTRVAEEILRDIDKETVDFAPNYDGSREEPTVLPAAVPNLLLNGASGIAVGMATNIPPHNLGELVDGIVAYVDSPMGEDGTREIDLDDLMQHIKAPDFPTGGVIYGYAGVKQAYRTGRGRVIMRAKMHEEEIREGRLALIVSEIPYQVNKSTLLTKIADAVRDKRVEGISDLRDESDRDGMRIVMELKRDAVPAVVQNQLFKYTQLQHTFGVNTVALVNGRPRVLTLKEMIRYYVEHRHEVVVRRTQYELRKAEERAHVLEGLTLALDHLDEVIAIIRNSATTEEARLNLMAGAYPQKLTADVLARMGLNPVPPADRMTERLASALQFTQHGEDLPEEFVPRPWLSDAQARAILDLTLRRLTGLEQDKILGEYRALIQEIERLRAILGSEDLRMQIIKTELLEIKEKYADERRSEIDYMGGGDIDLEDLIEDEPMVVTVTHQGLVKRTALGEYRSQGRGGRGMRGTGTRDEDFVEHLFTCSTHDYLLFFTDLGQCYWLRVYDAPEGGRTAKGRSIRNLIQIPQDDRLRAVLRVKKDNFRSDEFLNSHYVLMVTKKGQVKKTVLEQFSRPRVDGIIAISIDDDDQLLEARLTDGDTEVMLGCSGGRSIRFHESDARAMGRNTRGVRGMTLRDGEEVVGMIAFKREGAQVLTVSENGYGKKTDLSEYRQQSRGGLGIATHKTTSKTGNLVALKSVTDEDDLMIVTQHGTMIRMGVGDISSYGRNTQGVRVINLRDGDQIADVARLILDPEDDDENGDALQAAADPSGDGAVQPAEPSED
ncbi:MAG: DNA gyrase subunit A [Bacteroidota bacterium]